jgi:SNF2 family DNA or RNA helicase
VAYGKAAERQSKLNEQINKIMLRRLKGHTIADQLSNKQEYVVFCPMSALQIRIYKRILNSPVCIIFSIKTFLLFTHFDDLLFLCI